MERKFRIWTNKEYKTAFIGWYKIYDLKEIDKDVLPFLSYDIRPRDFQREGWLEKARKASFLAPRSIAKRAGFSRVAYDRFEEGERKGTITLNSLHKVAEAMDCELVYAIRPKNRNTFSYNIWQKLLKAGMKKRLLQRCNQKRRGAVLGGIAKRLMYDPQFKRDQGWSQRINNDD